MSSLSLKSIQMGFLKFCSHINKNLGPHKIYLKLLSQCYLMSLHHGIVPCDQKTANVSPIKNKADRKLGNIYIYLLIRECRSLILDSQHCFLNNISCLSNLLTFSNELFVVYDVPNQLILCT